MRPRTIPSSPGVTARFWEKVQKTSSCWIWMGARSSGGYGSLGVGGVSWKAHRFSYTLRYGPIEDGLRLDHLCRNTACVNPAHLEPVTGRVNMLRGVSPAAKAHKAGTCTKGHDLSGELGFDTPCGRRRCRVCRLNAQRAWHAKRKSKEGESH